MSSVQSADGISALQVQFLQLACAKHQTYLPSGERAGFFLGDGEPLTQYAADFLTAELSKLRCALLACGALTKLITFSACMQLHRGTVSWCPLKCDNKCTGWSQKL